MSKKRKLPSFNFKFYIHQHPAKASSSSLLYNLKHHHTMLVTILRKESACKLPIFSARLPEIKIYSFNQFAQCRSIPRSTFITDNNFAFHVLNSTNSIQHMSTLRTCTFCSMCYRTGSPSHGKPPNLAIPPFPKNRLCLHSPAMFHMHRHPQFIAVFSFRRSTFL